MFQLNEVVNMFGRQKKERVSLQEHNEELFLAVVKNLRMVFDPESPVNVYDLGLIYNLDIDEDHTVYVRMTLTAPNCPEAETIPGRIQQAVQDAEGVEDVDMELVFDPPWTRERMSTAALLALGLI
jgi:FeS assembly SUF system protein